MNMKVCVYGAGAVGGHLAGRLAEAGGDVSLIARGPHLAAIRAKGLRVDTTAGPLLSRPAATDDPRELGPQDVVVVTVKAPALPQVAGAIGPLLHADTAVVFAMNGIPWWYFHGEAGRFGGLKLSRLDPGDALWTAVGPERAVGAVAYTACSVTSPGVVRAENPRNRIVLGRPDGLTDPRIEALGQLLSRGGLEIETTSRIRDAIWSKLVMNLVGGSLAVLTGFAMKDVLSSPAIASAAANMAAEAMAVAHALGCRLDDPAPALARLATSKHKQSILQDLELGRSMEVDAMLKAPLELAELVGVETPTLALIVQLAMLRARSAGLYQG
jgi:2-dehydropantoate 2-reductase